MHPEEHRDRIERALRAAEPSVPPDIADGLVRAAAASDARLSDARLAHLVGQTGHESAGFTRLEEDLGYSAERLVAVWPDRFPDPAAAAPYAGNPRRLAAHVYNGRLGNRQEGEDGWTYRGRGLLHLTGRGNYRSFGRILGLPLEDEPHRAAEPVTGWRIAIAYFARRRRAGLTAFEWADRGDAAMVTRVVNGGLNGLADRRRRTAAALAALAGTALRPTLRRGARGAPVEALQRALLAAGFGPGPTDGAFGARTEAALRAFQKIRGLAPDGIAGRRSWAALAPTGQEAS